MRSTQPDIDQAVIDNCPADAEAAIPYLRESGLSKVQSIYVLGTQFGVPAPEAKSLVHLSPAWADVYSRDERLHDQIEAAAKELALGQRKRSME